MRLRELSTTLCFTVLLVACLVVIGWIIDIPILKSIFPGLATMKFNTALGFILLSLSLLAYLKTKNKLVYWSAAVLVTLLGALSFMEYALDVNLRIDELFIADPETPLQDFPGRMSMATAFGFMIFGISLMLIYVNRVKAGQFFAIAGNSFMTIPILGYLFNVGGLYDISIFSTIALHTSIGFVLFGTAVLIAQPESELMQVIRHPGPAGQMFRRSLPYAFGIPVVVGLVTNLAESANIFNYIIGQAILVQTIILFRLLSMWRNTRTVIQKQAIQDEFAERARISLEKFHNIFRESADIIVIIDENTGNIINVSPASKVHLDIEPADLIGQHFKALFKDTIEPGFIENVNFTREFMLEQPVRQADGTFRPMDLTAKVIPWENGRAVMVTLRNVSERKRLQEELMLAQLKQIEIEKEHELVKMKESFIAEVSHDFKTPLSVISLSSDILHRYYDRLNLDQTLTHLERIRFQAHFMKEMIDDVMTYVEAHQGEIFIQKKMMNVIELCNTIINDLNYQFPKRDIKLMLRSQMKNLLLDPRLMRRAINNLLTNALKYSTDDKPVFLRLNLEKGDLIIEVEDQGIGIPQEDCDRLFNAFQRASNTGDIKGTGLGLVIVKDCVAVHGGTISFVSEVGTGTTFTLRIPVQNGHSTLQDIYTA